MKILQKRPSYDFTVLNLTDPQLINHEWDEGHIGRRVLEYTVKELIERVSPDLITVSGDLALTGNDHAYDMFASFLEGFNIPWAPVWGNHDNQGGAEYIDKLADRYMTYPNCIYEKGDSSLGNGNYVILIKEGEKAVEAIVMMDSHDREVYRDADGNEGDAWAKLTSKQICWLSEQLSYIKEIGCPDATLVLHIPIFAYRSASEAAYRSGIKLEELTVEATEGGECWNVGYEDSVGVQYEGISSYPAEDGVFAALKASEIVRHVLAGHDHINNWIISYDGIKLIYGLKTGAGCYWDKRLNGGTVFKINESGAYSVYHEYVDVSSIL